ELRTYRQRAFRTPTRYQLLVRGEPDALALLREAGILSSRNAPLAKPPKRVAGRSCCRAAYIRGAMLGGGSLSGPRDVQLEVRAASLEGLEFLRRLAAHEGLELRLRERPRH